jgi:DNA primase
MKQLKDSQQIILEQLNIYGGEQTVSGDWIMVVCPFHEDQNPSLGLYMDPNGERFGIHCLGCGKTGNWNTFAEKTGLLPIKTWHKAENVLPLVSAFLEQQLFEELTIKSVLKLMKAEEAQPWPAKLRWRGFDGQLIRDVGGLVCNDSYNDSINLIFPIYINNGIKGAFKASLKKQKGKPSYLNMSGKWVERYGIFPYSYTKKLIDASGYDFVIIVEGPRDALRLLRQGIPALSIMGVETVTLVKSTLIAALGISLVYVMPDNDDGGKILWKKMKGYMNQLELTVKRMKLPESERKIDPGNMPKETLKKVVKFLTINHNLR